MKLSKKLENLFSAAAFAEAGEFNTARRIAAENDGTTGPGGARASHEIRHGVTQLKPRRAASKA